MPKHAYEKLNDYVMAVIYSPILLVTAYMETRSARRVRFNRGRNESDDDTVEVWEQLLDQVDFEGEGWGKRVEGSRPDVVRDGVSVAVEGVAGGVKELKEEIRELREEVRGLRERSGGTGG